MALLDRVRRLLRRVSGTTTPSRVGVRRPTAAPRPGDASREDVLRARLQDDPNDVAAFAALAELVRRRAAEDPRMDPLTAEAEPAGRQASADLAVWALAEEFAGNPRGWYPLIELARLSLVDDHEGAMRRLGAAVERETTGRALADGIRMLRDAGMPQDGLSFGVGHWDPATHIPEAGRQLVLAAVDAGRPDDARRHIAELAASSDDAETATLVDELTERLHS